MKMKLQSLNDVSIKDPIIDRRGSGGTYNYIKWDSDNQFSGKLLELIENSPLQKSILESLYLKMIGASIDVPFSNKPNLLQSWSELIRKCMKDYSIFESFSLQLVLNLDGKTWSFYHQPISEVRFGKSEYGINDIKDAYLCADWSQAKTSKIKRIKMFGSETPVEGEKYLVYFKEYYPQEFYYHTPSYFSGANWIAADGRLSRYYNNFIANNLSTSKVIKYPMDMSEDEKRELYDGLRREFSGDSAAGSFMLLFGDGTQTPEIDSLSTPDADLYNNVCDKVRDNIITANRLSSPTLAGVATGSNMSSQAEQLIAADVVYKQNVVLPMRTFVLSKINELLSLNNIVEPITIYDYNLRDEFEGQTATNDVIEDKASEQE